MLQGSSAENGNERFKHAVLRLLSSVLRLPLMRGRVTISEFFYRLLNPRASVAEMRVGGLPVHVDLSQQEARYIYFGAFERREVEFVRRTVKAGDVAVDVGANVGYISAVLAAAGCERVYAFEPNPQVFARLKLLAQASHGTIEAFPYAVTDEAGSKIAAAHFYVVPGHDMWSTTIGETGTPNAKEIVVPAVSLSDFFHARGISKINFVKIDVERGEAAVLAGMHRLLAAGHKPVIMCEIAADDGTVRRQSLAAVEKLLTDFKYCAHSIGVRGRLVLMSLMEIKELSTTTNLVFLPVSTT